ncbi:MAG: helix-turn-helix domain-containing protein [Dissulfurispiraceae bacterium]
MVLIAYRYRVYPTDIQVLSMQNWMGSLCHLGNKAIQERKEAYKATGKGLLVTGRRRLDLFSIQTP